MKNIIANIIILSFMLFIFLGCGTSISSSSTNNADDNKSTTIEIALNGVVVDGLISGANVCLDTDFNGLCGVDEQVVKTNSKGEFSFGTALAYAGSGVSYVAYGGVDTATGKDFQEQFRAIRTLDSANDTVTYITPLSDLVAKEFLKTDTQDISALEDSKNTISIAFGISKSILMQSPRSYGGVYIRSQELQQIKNILFTAINKDSTSVLNFSQIVNLKESIKDAILLSIYDNNGYIDIDTVFKYLEEDTGKLIANNEKVFIKAQLANIRVALEKYNNNFKASDPRFDEYQKALEDEADIAYQTIKNASDNDVLTPFSIDIDVYAVDENTTDGGDTNSTDDTNDTTQSNDLNLTFSGVVMDGPIEGSSVCLDLNLDEECSSTEPKVLSDANGNFSFENITMDQNSTFSIMSSYGTDTFSKRTYPNILRTVVVADDITSSSVVHVTPITDLVSIDFLSKSTLNSSELLESQVSISSAMDITSLEVFSDITNNVDIFIKSLYLEQIKKQVEYVIRNTQGYSSSTDLRVLRKKIKVALFNELSRVGFQSMQVLNILNSVGSGMGLYISESDTNFFISLMGEINASLNTLRQSENIFTYTLPTVQLMLEDRLDDVSYDDILTSDINISVETVTASEFDISEAEFDENACLKNTIYKNTLSDTNETVSYKSDTQGNGLSVLSNYLDTTAYYPELEAVPTGSNTITELVDKFIIYFDEAWVGQGKKIYIKTKSFDDINVSECYRIKLESTTQANINTEKVFRYSY